MWREKDIIRAYQKGDAIIKEGETGREMFIIKSGSVDVLKGEEDNQIHLATLERGDFFGEMAILENEPRSATVIAREETHLLVLNTGNFMLKIRKDPTFAFNIMQKMSSRIRLLNEKLLGQKGISTANHSGINKEIAETEYLKDAGL
ncbi:MAG: cyclic nucleotide-binding domain-containing protein [Nitrospirota bacterium]